MELVNSTPIPAKLVVTTAPPADGRIGMVVAKATFTLARGTSPRLATHAAEPVHEDDVAASDGLLPGDVVPRRDSAMEVILLGRARAPHDRPTTSLTVTLAVGDHRRELVVLGDRQWAPGRSGLVASAPEPFTAMPLDWSRAFGGRAEVWLDRSAPMEVCDPVNPRGRGFDPRPIAEGLCRHLGAPAGYPVVPTQRALPNLEDPACRIRHPDDRPVPACWATVPRDVGVAFAGLATAGAGAESPAALQELEARAQQAVAFGVLHRCHPAWRLPPLSREAEVRWSGLSDSAGTGFRLPALRVLADALVGEQHSTLELRPQVLVLRPDRACLHLTYRGFFRVSAPRPGPRVMRLRLAEGWMS